MDKAKFNDEKEFLLQEAEKIFDIKDAKKIAETAETLEGYNYSPTLLWPINRFVHMDKEKLIRVMREAGEAPEAELVEYGFDAAEDLDEKRLIQMRALLHHYRLLLRLRNGEPEAWEEFNELYEDD